MTQSTGKRRYGLSTKVLDYLKTRPNEVLSAHEIGSAVGLSDSDVSSSIAHLRTRLGFNIEIPIRGEYIYHTGKRVEITARTEQLYEVVGRTANYTLVRDESGELFVLTPLVQIMGKVNP